MWPTDLQETQQNVTAVLNNHAHLMRKIHIDLTRLLASRTKTYMQHMQPVRGALSLGCSLRSRNANRCLYGSKVFDFSQQIANSRYYFWGTDSTVGRVTGILTFFAPWAYGSTGVKGAAHSTLERFISQTISMIFTTSPPHKLQFRYLNNIVGPGSAKTYLRCKN